MREKDKALIAPVAGYSPHIGVLVDTLQCCRSKTVEWLQDLTLYQLDFLYDATANSMGALLLHLCALEVAVQEYSFHGRGTMAFKRWLYRGGRPNRLAKLINKGWAAIHSLGIFPNYMVTLEVVGRKSGKTVSFPLAMTIMNGERYLVSMLGANTNWVKNVRAADGNAVLRHGMRESVRLVEVDVSRRAPILKAYLQIAPGARPHIAISKDASITEFEGIASNYPVFKVESTP